MKSLFFALAMSLLALSLNAQNYTTLANGNWATGSVWSNTSGWGSATPPLSGQNSGTVSINHNITVSTNYTLGSNTINIAAGKTLTINGNLELGGGSTINVSGTLIVSGTTLLNSNLNILPGGQVYLTGTLTVSSAQYLTVGTNAAGPPYADLITYGYIVSNSSGDILVQRNGRLAAFGNITGSGGGTVLQVNNGGQAYVHGNIGFTGGGSSIVNNNTTSPYGLYVNGNVTNTGGGSSTTANKGDEVTMANTNPTFDTWIKNLPLSPLPVTLLYFSHDIDGKVVNLNWATATEKNSDYFVVERSVDGINFFSVDSIAASGNSITKKTYSTIDKKPLLGRSYYRLKAVDLDGSFEHFNIIVVQYKAEKEFSLYPNVVATGSKLTLELNFSEIDKSSTATILNLSGKVISHFALTDRVVEYPANFESGLYIVIVRSGGTTLQKRMIVR